MLKTINWRYLTAILILQLIVFLVARAEEDLATVSFYCATVLLAAVHGGYSLGVLTAATAATLFIYGTYSGDTPAIFWLRHGVDVAFMLALGVTVGRMLDDHRETAKRSLRDALTGLYNREFLDTQLRAEFDRSGRYGHALSAMMIDIDHFKNFNDRHGHHKGDLALKQVAHVLRTRLRSSDIACRYGGEEFAVILPETTPGACRAVGERLRSEVSTSTLYAPGIAEKLTISIGIAGRVEGMETAEDLLGAADKALYDAKEHGRDQVVLVEEAEAIRASEEREQG